MTQENLQIVLGNALCCSAQKAVELSDMLSKGLRCSDKYKRELVVLNNSIQELLCHGIENNSVFEKVITCEEYNILDTTIPLAGTKTYYIEIVSDGETLIYSIIADGIENIYALFLILMATIPSIIDFTVTTECITYQDLTGERVFTATLDCSVTSFKMYAVKSDGTSSGNDLFFDLITIPVITPFLFFIM